MSRIRTFVAIELPNDIRRAITKVIDKLAPFSNDVRWVSAENLHITLVFLGDVEDRSVHAACQAVARACAKIEPFHVSIQGTGVFPKPDRPRVLWTGLDVGAEEITNLREQVANELDAAGFQFDWKFSPHITIGRVNRGRFSDHELVAKSTEFADKPFGEFVITDVSVMSSLLEKSGATYVRLSSAPLEG